MPAPLQNVSTNCRTKWFQLKGIEHSVVVITVVFSPAFWLTPGSSYIIGFITISRLLDCNLLDGDVLRMLRPTWQKK